MKRFIYHLRLEGVGLRSRLGGGVRVVAIHAALIAAFGVFLPWMRGLAFLDPVMLAAYACLGVLFAAPSAAQAFAGERPVSLTNALARIAAAVLYGELMTVAILAAAFVTLHVAYPQPGTIGLDVVGLAQMAALGISASLAMASVAGWITLRFSPGSARMAMRLIFLALLLLFFFRSRWLPDVLASGTLISLAVAAAAILALRGLIYNRQF